MSFCPSVFKMFKVFLLNPWVSVLCMFLHVDLLYGFLSSLIPDVKVGETDSTPFFISSGSCKV